MKRNRWLVVFGIFSLVLGMSSLAGAYAAATSPDDVATISGDSFPVFQITDDKPVAATGAAPSTPDAAKPTSPAAAPVAAPIATPSPEPAPAAAAAKAPALAFTGAETLPLTGLGMLLTGLGMASMWVGLQRRDRRLAYAPAWAGRA